MGVYCSGEIVGMLFGKNNKDNLALTVDKRLLDILLKGEKDMLYDALDTLLMGLSKTTLSIQKSEKTVIASTEVNSDFLREIEYDCSFVEFTDDGNIESTFYRSRTAFYEFKPLKYGRIVVGALLIEGIMAVDIAGIYGKYFDTILQKLSLIAYISVINQYVKKKDIIDPATGMRTKDTLVKDFSKLIKNRGNDYLTYVVVGVTNLNKIRMEKGHPSVNDTIYRFVRKFRESLGRDLYQVSEDRFAFLVDKNVYIAREMLSDIIDGVHTELPSLDIKGVVVSIISDIDFADYYIGLANKTLTERIVLPSKGDTITVLHGVEPILLKEDNDIKHEEI